MSILERLRELIDEDVNEPVDRLMDETADEILRLQGAKRAALKIADERSKANVELRGGLKNGFKRRSIFISRSSG